MVSERCIASLFALVTNVCPMVALLVNSKYLFVESAQVYIC